ncbi:cytochrome c biogenesis protein [Methanocella arvoryzae]|uniref:Cytochrome c assembly protein n=1 Tax=Methanocella arvoryzae (strain DSM 22066 / NBRC 105507 / MRE50) TaxID=351160 RepID=Q0W8J6_METAR|nr:cytochrome c biogenesis protein CcsA [Methanocella arvoryzae]CAJ35297.1 cytochrome c assembly protein [Methanocella arvoryzae MRE50]
MIAEQWVLAAGAAIFVATIIAIRFHLDRLVPWIASSGCAAILLALLFRLIATGRVPWASLSESAALLALIVSVAAVISILKDMPRPMSYFLVIVAATLAAFSAASWEAPGTLPVSLQSEWLLVHVPIAIVSYGLFACSAAASAAYLYYMVKRPSESAKTARLDRLSITCITVGLLLLVIAIIMGSLWAKAAWGSYWSWDPKETWSLITAIVYGAYLVLRRAGMKGEEAAYVSLIGFGCVIFTYLGVSYIIPGLHSYA